MATRLADSPARDLYLALVRTHELLVGQFADLCRAHGTTQAQFNVLRVLIQAPEGIASCAEIAAGLIHRVPDVTRLIDRMETAGWVARRRGEADRRVVLVSITDAGRGLCEVLYPQIEALHERQAEPLSATELTGLATGLRRLLEQHPSLPVSAGQDGR